MSRALGTRPDPVRERFLAAGPELRSGPEAHPTAGSAYSALALQLLGDRPRALLLANGGEGLGARALVTVQAGQPETALLGLYEARDGVVGDEATREILVRADEWARRAGCTRLLAPVDGSTWMAYRFRVPDPAGEAAGGHRRFSWEPSHPPRYLERFLLAGFHEALEYETLGLVFPQDGPYRVTDAAEQTRPALDAARAAGYRLRGLGEGDEPVPWGALHRLSSDAFSENPLYAPIPREAFRRLYGGALGPAARDYTHWIEDPEGRIRAVMLAFREDAAVVLKSVAVDRDHRGRHLSTALVHRVLATAASAGVFELISALVRTGNTSEFLSRRHLMPGVRTWRHRYAVLERELRP